MKNLCLLFVLFCSLISQGNPGDKQVVKAFVKDWLESSGSKECALKYLNIDDSYLKDERQRRLFFLLFEDFCLEIKKVLAKKGNTYKIISHVNDPTNDWAKKFNLEMEDYTGVFYIVTGDEPLTVIIVRNDKIISFCSHIRGGKYDLYIPWLINESLPK